jgi:hypothetical protein
MAIVIVPQHELAGEPHPVGRLASTLLSVAVAGAADPPRFRRGKALLGDNAVLRLEVSAGALRASVVGSQPTPYEVLISVTNIPLPAGLSNAAALQREHMTVLAPQSNELLASCTCPDDDTPCKHGVAALLALSGALVTRPELLLELRCGEMPVAPRAQVGSRASSERHLRLVPNTPPARPTVPPRGPAGTARFSQPGPAALRTPPTPPPSPFDTDEWRAFEGLDLPKPVAPEIARTAAPVGTAIVDRVDVGDVVRSAIEALRQFMR